MRAAALLALLAALPGRAAETVTPAQARASVVAALPPDIARGAGQGDLRGYLERLNPEQKQAALRSLTAKEGELGDDPATLGVIGQAYAGLGRVDEVRQVLENLRRRNPNDPEVRQLAGWVATQEHLRRDASRSGAGSGFAPAAAPAAGLGVTERKVQGLFRRGGNSAEFRSTLEDARGFSVAELKAAGITFSKAEAGQRDAVMITKTAEGVNIAVRDDALSSRGDAEARGAAHVANGVRQAQTYRDHSGLVAWGLVKARGWISGARTHQQLAPNDVEANPQTPSDLNLMMQRHLLDSRAEEAAPMPRKPVSYGDKDVNDMMASLAAMAKIRPSIEKIFEDFMRSTERSGTD